MKKTLLTCLAIIVSMFFTTLALAEDAVSDGQIMTKSGSIDEMPRMLTAAKAGPGLDIWIINFLPSEKIYASVQFKGGKREKQILGRTFFSVTDLEHTYPFDYVHVTLTNMKNQVFFDQDVFRRTTISVYSAASPPPKDAIRIEEVPH